MPGQALEPWELEEGYLTLPRFGEHLKNVAPESIMVRLEFRHFLGPNKRKAVLGK